MKNEYKLENGFKNIKFKINTGTITIYQDNIMVPTLFYSNLYRVNETGRGIKVTQNNNVNNTMRVGGMVINTSSNSSVFVSNNVTIVNGRVLSGNAINIKTREETDDELEFVVPNDADDLEYDIAIDSGSLIMRDILAESVEANLMSGSIEMRDVDILKSKLKVMSGNIDLEIRQSILNYDTHLETMCGKVKQDHIDTANNINIVKKRILGANTMSGNIKVLFKN